MLKKALLLSSVALFVSSAAFASPVFQEAAETEKEETKDCGQSACKNSWLGVSTVQKKEIFAFGEDYKAFMDVSRTELSGIKEAIRLASDAGFKEYKTGDKLKPGMKYFHNNRDRAIALFVVGKRKAKEGLRVTAAHIDSPRLELKGRPIYEKEGFAMFQTNYHGGLKPYQWESIPLALVGHIDKKDGTRVEINIGLAADDPIFIIPSLSPHVDRILRNRKNRDVLALEEMDPVVASIPGEGKTKVKDMVVAMLQSEYGVSLSDLVSAELSLVPAMKPRDVGFDRALTAIYGQDDKLSSYATLRAILDMDSVPDYTAIVHLVDNEESGNNNNTGASSTDFVNFIEGLIYAQEGSKYRSPMLNYALRHTKVISIDVNAGINPLWPNVWEKGNAPRLGFGVNFKMYGRGFTANSEYTAWVRKILDDAGIPWQTATYKVGRGGGGTVGREYAKYNMEVIDFGVPLFSIHTPYAVSSKIDVWNLYRAAGVFFKAE